MIEEFEFEAGHGWISVGKGEDPEESLIIIGSCLMDPNPDYIRLPEDIGGGKAGIKSRRADCPFCDERCMTAELDNGMNVTDCKSRRLFLFWT